jgi:hypothetical protein
MNHPSPPKREKMETKPKLDETFEKYQDKPSITDNILS